MIPAHKREVENNSKMIGRKGQGDNTEISGGTTGKFFLPASTCFPHRDEIKDKIYPGSRD